MNEIHEIEEEEDAPFLREQGPKATQRTLEGVERVAKIVRAMKEFAHPAGLMQSHPDINRAMETTLIVAASELKNVTDVETHSK